jgi:hypothetical protein
MQQNAKMAADSDTSNLDKTISSIVAGRNCLVHLSTFQWTPLPHLGVPIILRDLELSLYQLLQNDKPLNVHSMVWIAKRSIQNNTIVFPKPRQASSFMENRDPDKTGSKLNAYRYPLFTKPWSCELHVSLFPPDFTFMANQMKISNITVATRIQKFFRNFGLPRIWFYNIDRYSKSNKFAMTLPPSIGSDAKVHMLVYNHNEFRKIHPHKVLRN